MNANLLMNFLWYEDIAPDELAGVLEISSKELFDKIFGDEEFTLEEIKEIVALLGLNEEETNMVFG